MPLNSPYMIDPNGSYGALLARATEQLQRQAEAGSQQQVPIGGDPDYQMYGIFGPQYAASLARPRGAAGGDLLRHAALGMHTANEQDAYGEALRAAGQRALRQTQSEGATDVEVARIGKTPNQILSNETSLGYNALGDPVMQTNAPESMVGDQLRGNTAQSEIVENYGAAIKDLYTGGIRVPEQTASGWVTPPTQATPTPVTAFNPRGFNPGDETEQDKLPIEWYDAQSRRIAALAQQYRAQNPDNTLRTTWVEGDRVYALTQEGAAVDIGSANDPQAVPPTGQPHGPSAETGVGQPSPMQQGVIDRLPQGYNHQMAGEMLVVVAPSGAAVAVDPSGQRRQLQQQQRPGAPPQGGAQ